MKLLYARISSVVKGFNPFTAKGDLIDFTLSNAKRFHLSKRDPLASLRVKKKLSLNPFTAKGDFIDFTLSNAKRFHS